MRDYIELKTLKSAELILRFTMAITLLAAGVSKFFSGGSFHAYYLKQFSNEALRINLPVFTFDIYLTFIPYIEVAIAIALLTSIKRRLFIVVWIAYFISLEMGHYVLEEFTSANQIIPYIVMGVLAYILPGYEFDLTKRKSDTAN
ncbi:MAG: hypothetical protein WBD22_06415 [Pyrinomonadaceae bacterium]